jgi:dTDP-4-amino-4,6-dideoxygalactose transaminase
MINLFEPDISKQSFELLGDIAKSRWLGRGSYVVEFEKLFAAFQNVDPAHVHTISCCSDAIFGVLDIVGIEADDEVIVPSISFPAVGSAVVKHGAKLVVVDSMANTGNANIEAIGNAVTDRTRAVFVTHYGGAPVDIAALRAIVGPEIFILEDAACAFGSFRNGVAIGTEGDFGCWSFDAMKLMTCGEGGAIYFKDPKHVERAKEYFYLGLPAQSKSGIDRQGTDNRWWEYQLTRPGRRSIFTNINAAFGIPQYDTLSDVLEKRAAIRRRYIDCLTKAGGMFVEQIDQSVSYSNYFFTVLSPKRDELASYLKEKGIYSTFRYYPLHLIDIFKPFAKPCQGAFDFSETALNIPIHQNLSDDDVEKICDALTGFHRRG